MTEKPTLHVPMVANCLRSETFFGQHFPFVVQIIFVFCILCLGCTVASHDKLRINPRNEATAKRQFLVETARQILEPPLKSTSVSDGFALLVGVEDANVSIKGFQTLRYPSEEVKRMRECLETSGYRVKTLINEQATRQNILRWVRFFSNLRGRNRLFFYYTGHGTIYGKEAVTQHKTEITGIYPHLVPEAWVDIEGRLIESIYSPLGTHPPPKSLPDQVVDRINRSFFLMPYQPPVGIDTGPFHKFRELVGYDEIAAIISKSSSTEKILIIDACSAGLPKSPIFNPLPAYSHDIQRQGYAFLTVINANENMKIYENVFTPVIVSGLQGNADLSGNRDGVVSVFELIRYANAHWSRTQLSYGIRPNQMSHMLFGSTDIPVTIRKKRSRP